MPLMIRQGDTTSHGGTVLEGFSLYTVEGRAVAGMGHNVACPLCNGVFPIVQGNPTHTVNGVPLAYDGMLTACGATLVASPNLVNHASAGGSITRLIEPLLPDNPVGNQPEDKTIQFVIRQQESRKPLEGVPYTIELSTGQSVHGHSDSAGLTKKLVVKQSISADLVVHGKS